MTQRDEVISFLTGNKDFLYDRFRITKIGIFGSVARDEQTENSDIDFCVEFEENTEDLFEKKLALREFLTAKFHTSIDICRERSIKPVFRSLIMKDLIYA
jgi:predicted nucleotidyltransferase